ncbi:MAG TPA: TIR domain-containing protein [Kofleriaceae bacterium]
MLIDSRTGMSDAGGICTIQMPDVLVTMFTANYQSVFGVRDVIQSAQSARQRLAYDRMALTVLPLPSRFPHGGDSKLSNEWLDRIATELGACLADWLPRGIDPRSVLERLAIPQRDEFALGERLAVAEQKTAGAEALTAVYDRIAALLAAEFRDIEAALGPIEPSSMSRSVAWALEKPAHGPSKLPVENDVFVSYPRAGSVLSEWTYGFIVALMKAFTALGRSASFYIDLEDRADAEFDRLRPILDRSRVLLAILTPHYLVSSWCLAEWQAFEDREQTEGRTLIVPVALRGVAALPGRFSERVVVDGSGTDLADTSDAAMATLVDRTVKALVATLEGRSSPKRGPDPQSAPIDTRWSTKVGRARYPILLLAANPLSAGQLALQVEAKEIWRAIDASQFRARFQLDLSWNVKLDELLGYLRNLNPAVVHFSGQGASDGVYLVGRDGLPQLVPGAVLAQLIRAAGSDLRLVVLSGCYSEKQAAALSAVVDCVVGVVASISDEATVAFSAAFYAALASGRSVASACQQGRAAILLRAASSERWSKDSGETIRLQTRPGVRADAVSFATQPRPPKAPPGKRRVSTR